MSNFSIIPTATFSDVLNANIVLDVNGERLFAFRKHVDEALCVKYSVSACPSNVAFYSRFTTVMHDVDACKSILFGILHCLDNKDAASDIASILKDECNTFSVCI